MELSVAVSSCDFRPPAARLGSARALSVRAIETSSANLRGGNATRRKIRVGARAGTFCGQPMGVRVASGARWTASTWLDNSLWTKGKRAGDSTKLEMGNQLNAQVEADVPLSEAWALWSNQENVVNWMPWIASVKVMEGKPNLSKWTLRYSAFGQNFEFSWMARLLKPIQNQKIHWRSVDGLANRGAVRFYPRGPTSCGIELTISYEIPDVLAPFGTGVKPLVESILKSDLDRFAVYAKKQSTKKTIPRQ